MLPLQWGRVLKNFFTEIIDFFCKNTSSGKWLIGKEGI